jgi:hypothetical protein
MLFDEPDPATRDAQRTSPVAKAEPSPAAQRNAARKRTDARNACPPAMSSTSGAITSPPSSPPPPTLRAAPWICSASPPPRRQTDTAHAKLSR